jgi:hypothetical protein
MESKAKRTLVKSVPELWEVASDPARMETWTAGLIGTEEPIPVEVIDADAGRVLAWRSTDPASPARIEIELSDSGFGTAVRVTAQHSHPDPGAVDALLERLLDELGAPERKPYTRA